MLSRSFTKAEIGINKLKHKQLPPQIYFAKLQDSTLKPVHYLIKHEEVLPHQKHDSQPILAHFGTSQFSLRINDERNDTIVKTLNSFSFKTVTPFQTIESQRNKHFNIKIQTASTQPFSEHAPSFNYRISMDTKRPTNPPSHNKSYIPVIFDAFSHLVVTVPIKANNAKTAIKTLSYHWIIQFGPPIYLVTD